LSTIINKAPSYASGFAFPRLLLLDRLDLDDTEEDLDDPVVIEEAEEEDTETDAGKVDNPKEDEEQDERPADRGEKLARLGIVLEVVVQEVVGNRGEDRSDMLVRLGILPSES
jgi:hypothetical protein